MMYSPKMDDGVIGLLDGKGELAPVCFRFSVFFPLFFCLWHFDTVLGIRKEHRTCKNLPPTVPTVFLGRCWNTMICGETGDQRKIDS